MLSRQALRSPRTPVAAVNLVCRAPQVSALALTDASAVKFVGRNRLDVLVELDRDAFDSITPDFGLLESFGPRAVCVTAPGRESERYATHTSGVVGCAPWLTLAAATATTVPTS